VVADLGAVRGVVPVVETPFDPDGRVDRRSFQRLTEYLAGTGISAAMYPGYASEFYKLDDAERNGLVADMIVATRDLPVTPVVSVTDHGTRTALLRTRAYLDLGAEAINLLPPRQPVPGKQPVLEHVATVLDAASPVPVVLQYAPQQGGVGLAPADLGDLARHHPNLAAVKVETDRPAQLITALRCGQPSLPCLVGNAGRQLLPALRAGAVGVQPGCSLVEVYLRVWDDWAAGRREQATSVHRGLLDYLTEWAGGAEHIVAVEKLLSYRRGLIDSPFCRPPAHRLDEADLEAVERCLVEFADLLAEPARSLSGGLRAGG